MATDENNKNSNHSNTHSPKKVLVADDDAPTRILLRAAVSQWGYEVIEAEDGEQAWGILQIPDPPKLIIADCLMPNLGGVDLCKRVKSQFEFFTYIILLTQLKGTSNITQGLDAGADEFLSKPFNMAELRSRLTVGSRIVTYEENLIHKNQELSAYLERLKELGLIIPDVESKVDMVLDQFKELAQHNGSMQDKESLNSLQRNLQQMLRLIKEICPEEVVEKEGDMS